MDLISQPAAQLRIADIALALVLCATTAAFVGCGDATADAGTSATAKGAANNSKTRSVAVSPSDIATVHIGSLSDGVPITGLLRPLESVDVHSRIEGDLTGVFVREGQHVAKGQMLAQFEAVVQQSSAASARAGQAAAKADLSQAEWNLKQSGDLFHAGAISEADYRASQQASDAARARLAAANAAVDVANIIERDTRVVAPLTGVIDKKLVDVGEHLSSGSPMFTLVRSQTLELAATVPERRAAAIKIGQTVQFSAQGLDFNGKVARVSPTIDPTTRAITVYVDVDNSSGALKGNSLATGDVIASTVNGVLLIPTTALHQTADSGKTYVYRANTGRIEQVYITLGIVNDQAGLAQVLSGLTTGDKVMVGNLGTMSPGTEIQVIGGDHAPGKQ